MTQHFTTPSPVNPTTEHGNWNTPPAPQKPKAWWKKPIIILPVAAFVLGSGLGAMNQPEPVTVTKDVPGPERIVEKPVEKIVEKEVTPASCLTALDLTDEGFGYAAEIIGYLNDGIQAAGRMNAAGLNEATANMEVVNPKLKALVDPTKAAKSECRASAK